MKKYLIVEDNGQELEGIVKLLRGHGYSVTESSGAVSLPEPACCLHVATPRDPCDTCAPHSETEQPHICDMLLSPDAILVTRAVDGAVLDSNESFTKLTGYGRGEMLGQTLLRLTFFLNPELWTHALDRLREEGEAPDLETRLLRKDGLIAFVHVSLRPLEIDGLACHVVTIRERPHNAADEMPDWRHTPAAPGLENLLAPDVDINREEVGRLIEFQAIQDLMNSFYKITRIGIGINDIKGNVQVATGWQDVCTKFFRIHPETLENCLESDIHLSLKLGQGEVLYKCKHGMWELATPLVIGGRHIANIFLGQFFFEDETPDYEFFRKQAEQYGFNVEEFLTALDRVPRWSRELVHNVMEFYRKLAVLISRLSIGNIQLSRALLDQKKVEEELRFTQFAIDKTVDQAFWIDEESRLFYVNDAACRSLGYSREELIGKSVADIDPRYTADLLAQSWSMLREDGTGTIETMHRAKDGRVYPVEIRGNFVVFDGKEYNCSFATDISKRKQAEESLRLANLVVENSPVVLFRWKAAEGWPVEMVSRNVIQFGYTPDELLSGDVPFSSIVFPADLEQVSAEVEAHVRSGEDRFQQEYRIVTREGEIRWIDDHTLVERDAQGAVTHFQGIVMDITERKRTESVIMARLRLLQFAETHSLDELLEATLNEAEALTGSHIGFFHFLEDDQETISLQNWSTRTKAECCKAQGKGLHYDVSAAGVWVDCIRERRPVIHNDYAALLHRKGLPPGHAPVDRELVVPVIRGENIVAIVGVGNKARDYSPQDVETLSLLADFAWGIASRKRTEEELRENEEIFRVLAETSPTAILLYQGEKIVYANPATERLFGYDSDELLRMNFWDWAQGEFKVEVRERGLSRLKGESAPTRYECKYVTKAGEERWLVASAGLIDYQGKPAGIASLLDITENKRSEERVRASLAEKVVLLKEVHHRVKNNLQIISSLLDLQSYSIRDEQSRSYFRDSQDRIRSMALVHERLYLSKNFASIDLGEYVRDLSRHLFDSHAVDSDRIFLKVVAGDLSLEIDRAIPCGLIINELMINSLKHAFPGQRAGEIVVCCAMREDGWIRVSVSDNGVGMPPGLDFMHTETLGLQLVTMLVKQLGGQINVEHDNGTSFVFLFPGKQRD
ncbi:MAG: PAS domain S-box protein [Desulfuromonadales bacterium]|nr:PAS domain S-box protein [Desulfuromonadales bacterium]